MFLMRQEARLWVATYLSSSSSGHGFCPSSEKRNFALPASAILTDRLHGTPSLSTTGSRKPPCRSRVCHDGSGPVKSRIIVIARSTCDEAIQLALRRYGLLRRGACHRARIRATRWLLALTLRERSDLAAPITCKSARCRRRPHRARLARSFCIQDDIPEPPGGSRPCRKRFGRMRLAAGPGRPRASPVTAPPGRCERWNPRSPPVLCPPPFPHP